MLRQIFSASLATAIAMCAVVSSATIILAKVTPDRRVTRPAAPKPISDRVVKPIVKPPVFVPRPNREPFGSRGASTR